MDERRGPTTVAFAMQPGLRERLFAPEDLDRLRAVARVEDEVLHDLGSDASRTVLSRTDVLLTGWGCPPVTREVLQGAPRLRAVVHAAGSVKHHLPPEFWVAGIPVSTAAGVNATPVAEYTVATVLLANKRVWPVAARYREHRRAEDWDALVGDAGNYRRTVGVVGASTIGRRVLGLLAPYDLDLLLSDPYVDAATAAELGARLVDLDTLVATSDVVSLHAPDLPETRHLMDARRLGAMRDGATLVNTARGALVDTDALTAAVVAGRLHAVLDVTTPEVLPADSPLYDHPNVLLTPHVAGSLGGELHRLGAFAVDEVGRWTRGEPFVAPVDAGMLHRTA
ncbi:hydroxyacid dehydrogenase [Isoptericola cucumis]|uniref:2-hydroxyacid dehydrogenase n=1 Tax=Isoptericola cucumis TaxID=1776856 RepID=A0ABQ2B283_9MICO|nr:hydroxyacid dehydrogenase [Isoptericola cucumis]GGI04336.1 2-hydroxyacid dehydrogenase [Isoptericola cucumis]